MRSRFFTGLQAHELGRLTGQVMRRSESDHDSIVPLMIHPSNKVDACQLVTRERIEDTYGAASPLESISRTVSPVEDVARFVKLAVKEAGIQTTIITANLERIARSATRNSEYYFMKRNGTRFIIGSRLNRTGALLHPNLADLPVFGPKKAEEAVKYAAAHKKMIGFAIGDSPNTDGHMLRLSLASGGIALAVGGDLDSTMYKFHSTFDLENFDRSKIYYVVEEE